MGDGTLGLLLLYCKLNYSLRYHIFTRLY